MARRNYPGFVMPEYAVDALEELRPLRRHMIEMGDQFFPYSPEWRKIHAVVDSLGELAEYFTGHRNYYDICCDGAPRRQDGSSTMPRSAPHSPVQGS